LDPTPETAQALAHLSVPDETGLSEELARLSREVLGIVPECIGLSLAVVEDGLTFTLVASDAEIAQLDAVQYLAGGPAVEATRAGRLISAAHPDDLLDEGRWQLFARASAAHRVESTLSLPIGDEDNFVAAVNLYAASSDAFVGHHEELAEALGAWAPGIISNADMSFSTRAAAARAPQQLRNQRDVDLAVGALAAAQGVSIAEASRRVQQAALRAGVPADMVARTILDVLRSDTL